jgi:hypothetical protein
VKEEINPSDYLGIILARFSTGFQIMVRIEMVLLDDFGINVVNDPALSLI